MIRVSSAEFQRQIGRYQDLALTEPVVISSRGRDRTVMMSIEEYERLRSSSRRAVALEEFTDEDIRALEAAEVPSEYSRFDHEVEG